MYTIKSAALSYSIDERGRVASFFNAFSGHEYVKAPGDLFKLIYTEGERTEIPVFSTDQSFSVENKTGSGMDLVYEGLQGDGRRLAVRLVLHFTALPDRMTVTADLENNDPSQMVELSITAVSGVQKLTDDEDLPKDYIAWPEKMGRAIPEPAFRDLSVYAGFRKYERHDYLHTDLDSLYPSRMSMQWYDWTNGLEGLYVGSHDTSGHTVCGHVERDIHQNILRMGFIRYPMIDQGETFSSAPLVYAPHLGDWHRGSAIYRTFMEESGYLKLTDQRQWAREFKGWLRVILKPHHCELNWDYHDIPRLFDDACSAGFDTLFLLGWEKGAFAKMWPDYILDDRMGGEKVLRDGIEYVHSRGGKVVMFLSYALLDHHSDFYRNGPGEQCTMKTVWGDEIPFSETYCGEATYRKIPNPPMPMYLSCAGSDTWQEKMLESADYVRNLGADGVLYDLGGLPAYFCYDKRHNHAKPSHSCEQKSARYAELRDRIHQSGPTGAILMEHTIDIFNMNMDIVHGSNNAGKKDDLVEMYRYTFPEFVVTNRECGQDESDYRNAVNRSVLFGLRFDMTIFRCCGMLADIPAYRDYLKEVNALLDAHKDTLLTGKFRDTDGFSIDNPALRAKSFESDQGRLEVVIWNPTDGKQNCSVNFHGTIKSLCIQPQSLGIVSR